jgi:hypothetical protein
MVANFAERVPAAWRSALRRFSILISLFVLVLSVSPPLAAGGVTDIPVLTTRAGEVQVAATQGYLAWEQNTRTRPGRFNVYARATGGSRFKVNARGTQGAMGGIDGTTLAYQQFGRRSDIKLFDLVTRTRSNPPSGVNTRRWEYWPDIRQPWLLFARLNGGAGTRSIILFNLDTLERRVLDVVGENKYIQPGQVNGNYAVWVHWSSGRSRIFVYDIITDTVTRVPNTRGYDWAPSVTENGTVYFGRAGRRCGSRPRWMRYPRGGSLATVLNFPSGIDMTDSYVFPRRDGSIQVFHTRVRCSNRRTGSDIYRFVDNYTVTLSITVVGSGSVTSDPPGISCGVDCSQEYEPGTQLMLTPQPAEGWTFTGWSDPSCPGTDPCTVSPTSDMSVTATFSST